MVDSVSSAYQFRQGTVINVAEFAKTRPGMVRAMTEAQIKEDQLYQQQTRLREEAVNRYATAHPDTVYGQVVVNGKLFATVYDSGSAATRSPVAMTENGSGEQLASARLADIARSVKGEIRYSNFMPEFSGPGSTMSDALAATLPTVTARPFGGFLDELQAAADRARLERARAGDTPNV